MTDDTDEEMDWDQMQLRAAFGVSDQNTVPDELEVEPTENMGLATLSDE